MWHAVAPLLAGSFTVVAADLPGYGDSFRPPVDDDHGAHSKRAWAADLVAAMAALGHPRFAVAGHDRGGRVAYRMALDAPAAVTRLAVLDIVPTGEIWARADATFALAYWHWPFLAQPAPLPERFMLGDPEGFWITVERMGLEARRPALPGRGRRRLPRAAARPRRGDRHVRGLPRGRHDRPRARRCRPRPGHRLPRPRAVGRRRRAPVPLRRPARGLARLRAPRDGRVRWTGPGTSWPRTSRARSRPTSPPSCPRTRSPFLPAPAARAGCGT